MSSSSIIPVTNTDAPYSETTRCQVYTHRHLDKIKTLQNLTLEQHFEMDVVSNVLPFRINDYVINELINWDNNPADPVFQLTFPQRVMLAPEDYDRMAELL